MPAPAAKPIRWATSSLTPAPAPHRFSSADVYDPTVAAEDLSHVGRAARVARHLADPRTSSLRHRTPAHRPAETPPAPTASNALASRTRLRSDACELPLQFAQRSQESHAGAGCAGAKSERNKRTVVAKRCVQVVQSVEKRRAHANRTLDGALHGLRQLCTAGWQEQPKLVGRPTWVEAPPREPRQSQKTEPTPSRPALPAARIRAPHRASARTVARRHVRRSRGSVARKHHARDGHSVSKAIGHRPSRDQRRVDPAPVRDDRARLTHVGTPSPRLGAKDRKAAGPRIHRTEPFYR
jgi:hypothetical protein